MGPRFGLFPGAFRDHPKGDFWTSNPTVIFSSCQDTSLTLPQLVGSRVTKDGWDILGQCEVETLGWLLGRGEGDCLK